MLCAVPLKAAVFFNFNKISKLKLIFSYIRININFFSLFFFTGEKVIFNDEINFIFALNEVFDYSILTKDCI